MNNTLMIKKIKLPSYVEISVATLQTRRFLIFMSEKHSKYMLVSKNLEFYKKDNILFFKLSSEHQNNYLELNQTHLLALKCLNSFEKPFKKRLILKGLGFRLGVSEKIRLTLFSHWVGIYLATGKAADCNQAKLYSV
jgi:ribosomal protein L6P/L9E